MKTTVLLLIIISDLCFCQISTLDCNCNVTLSIERSSTTKGMGCMELWMFSFDISIHVCDKSIVFTKNETLTTKTLTETFNWMCNRSYNSKIDSMSCTTLAAVSPPVLNHSTVTTSCVSQVALESVALPITNSNTVTTSCGSQVALGSAVGVLVLLLAVVTTGWIWTCWISSKRRQLKINSVKNRFTEIQAANENKSVNLGHNQAYGTQHENDSQESHNKSTEGNYEMISPLPYEVVCINVKQVKPDGAENSDVQEQTRQGITTTKQQLLPTHSLGEPDCKAGHGKDQPDCENGNKECPENVYHILEPPLKDRNATL